MSVTQFAMVEELAFLIRDNLPCKHLVLSMEDALVNFLEDENCTDGILELEPMDPYSRLLLHRLAEIFGFAHVSVGEGDGRHIVLERYPETSVPSIIVSDILHDYDETQPVVASHQLLRRENAPPVLKTNSPSSLTLEEREAAYLEARKRIFSRDGVEIERPYVRKPQNVPVVARRMIAHALGRKIDQTVELNVQDKGQLDQNPKFDRKEETLPSTGGRDSKTSGPSRNRVKEYSKEQQVGAAKRMFANALGLQSTKGSLSRCIVKKDTNPE